MYTDIKEFSRWINISKRPRLIRALKSISNRNGEFTILPLQGYELYRSKAKDDGLLAIAVRYRFCCEIYIDNISAGYEDFQRISFDMLKIEDTCQVGKLISFLQASRDESCIIKPTKEAKAWAGWKGGRPKRQLSIEEKASIDKMRQGGASINAIAASMHIGNRIISNYLKAASSERPPK